MLTLLRDLRRSRKAIALPAARRGRSLAICHVDAGSCNGCEHELNQLASPYYDLQRYGLDFVASPRHADVLLVTGAVTSRMREPLLIAYAAMPEPRRVVALGDSALGHDLLGSSEEIVGPVEAVLPVDLRIPGRPPTPGAILEALLSLVDDPPAERVAAAHSWQGVDVRGVLSNPLPLLEGLLNYYGPTSSQRRSSTKNGNKTSESNK